MRILIIYLVFIFTAIVIHGQDYSGDINIEGSSSTVLKSYSQSTIYNNTAILGEAVANTPTGKGVYGSGFIGVYALSTLSSISGYHIGIKGEAANGPANYGVFGYASGATSSTKYAGFFSGNFLSLGTYVGSDIKLKKNVSDINDGLSKVMKINTVQYEYKTDQFKELPIGKRKGVLADEIEKIIPCCIKEFKIPKIDAMDKVVISDSTYKAVNYDQLIPILVSSIQEQQKELKELRKQILKSK